MRVHAETERDARPTGAGDLNNTGGDEGMTAEYATIQDLLRAKRVVLQNEDGEFDVRITPEVYNGARLDRIRECNAITTGLGLPRLARDYVWCVDPDGRSGGYWLADVLTDVWRGKAALYADGRKLRIEDTGVRYDGDYMRWPPEGA